MRVYIKAKRIAVLGLFIAFNMLLLLLSTILEFNTLFLLALASFTVGIAVREYGFQMSFGFYLANTFLSFLLISNKFHCFTLAGMGIYLFLTEFIYFICIKIKSLSVSKILVTGSKVIIFNSVFIPVLVFAPQLLYHGRPNKGILLALLIGGQAVMIIYDMAYHYFMNTIWIKFSKYLR